jgi:hypothetical protein
MASFDDPLPIRLISPMPVAFAAPAIKLMDASLPFHHHNCFAYVIRQCLRTSVPVNRTGRYRVENPSRWPVARKHR